MVNKFLGPLFLSKVHQATKIINSNTHKLFAAFNQNDQ